MITVITRVSVVYCPVTDDKWKGVVEQGRAVKLGQALRMNGSGDCSL